MRRSSSVRHSRCNQRLCHPVLSLSSSQESVAVLPFTIRGHDSTNINKVNDTIIIHLNQTNDDQPTVLSRTD